MSENEAKEKHREEHGDKLDSFGIGGTKDGSIKIYFDLKNTTDAELMSRIKRAIGLWKYAQSMIK